MPKSKLEYRCARRAGAIKLAKQRRRRARAAAIASRQGGAAPKAWARAVLRQDKPSPESVERAVAKRARKAALRVVQKAA